MLCHEKNKIYHSFVLFFFAFFYDATLQNGSHKHLGSIWKAYWGQEAFNNHMRAMKTDCLKIEFRCRFNNILAWKRIQDLALVSFQNLNLNRFSCPGVWFCMIKGVRRIRNIICGKTRKRYPRPSVCCLLYLVAMSTLAPNIVSLALLYLWRRKRGGYPLLGETSLRQLYGTTRVPSKKLLVP